MIRLRESDDLRGAEGRSGSLIVESRDLLDHLSLGDHVTGYLQVTRVCRIFMEPTYENRFQ